MTTEHTGLTEAEIAALEDTELDGAEKDDEQLAAEEEERERLAAEAKSKADAEAAKKKEGSDDGSKSGDDAGGKPDKDDKAGAKAGGDDKPGVAPGDDKDGKGSDRDAADDEAAVADDIVFEPIAVFQPVMPNAEIKKIEAERDGKLKTYADEMKALEAEYKEGGVETSDYISRRDVIRDKVADAKADARAKLVDNDSAIRANKATVEGNWQAAQKVFTKHFPMFNGGGLLGVNFRTKVNSLLADPKSATMSDMDILRQCRDSVVKELKADGIIVPGLTDEKGNAVANKFSDADMKSAERKKAEAIRAAKAKNAKKTTQNLHDTPPAEGHEQEESWIEELDKMDATEREAALQKMPKARRNEYLGIE